jgi:hypothetical protein
VVTRTGRKSGWLVGVAIAAVAVAVATGPSFHMSGPPAHHDDNTRTVTLRVITREVGAKMFHPSIRYQPTRFGLVTWTVAGRSDTYNTLPWQQTFERVPVGSDVSLHATQYPTKDPKNERKNLPLLEFDCVILIDGHDAHPDEHQPGEATCSLEALVT